MVSNLSCRVHWCIHAGVEQSTFMTKLLVPKNAPASPTVCTGTFRSFSIFQMQFTSMSVCMTNQSQIPHTPFVSIALGG